MKIYVGMPAYFGVHPEVVRNLVSFNIDLQKEQSEMVLHFPQTSTLSLSRNLIVKGALRENADWILMWDSDIQVKDNRFLEFLIETAYKNDAAVVGLPCRLKSPTEIKFNFAMKTHDKGYVNFSELPPEPREVDVIGTGVMLINMGWLRKNWPIGPWFTVIDTESGSFPEDWTFCEWVKSRGGKVMVDPRVKTVHWGLTGFSF